MFSPGGGNEKADGKCGEESNVRPLLAFIEQEDPMHCDILKLMQKDAIMTLNS